MFILWPKDAESFLRTPLTVGESATREVGGKRWKKNAGCDRRD
jgi:hypothetical protein